MNVTNILMLYLRKICAFFIILRVLFVARLDHISFEWNEANETQDAINSSHRSSGSNGRTMPLWWLKAFEGWILGIKYEILIRSQNWYENERESLKAQHNCAVNSTAAYRVRASAYELCFLNHDCNHGCICREVEKSAWMRGGKRIRKTCVDLCVCIRCRSYAHPHDICLYVEQKY